MRANSRWVVLLCACTVALAVVWPADAYAQRRVFRGRSVVFVSAGFHYWPSYSPFFWPAYGPYLWGWYPSPFGYYPPYYAYRDDLGSARIQVNPKDAQVYVDGYFVGIVDDFDGFSQRLRVEPGEHDVQLYREGYRSITEKVLFRPGQTYRIKYAMEPLAAGEPNEPRPQPSATAPAPQPRSAPGYRPGRPQPRRGPDYPPPPPPDRADQSASFGTISIRVQPADAVVTIDGERWEWPQGDNRLVIQLPEGRHRIEIHKDGYRTFTRTVEIRSGEGTTLNVSLASEDR